MHIAIEKKECTAKFDLFNIGSGTFTSIDELVKLIVRCSGKKLRILYDYSKSSIENSICLSNFKAGYYLDWKPKMYLEESVQKVLEWYRNNIKE